MTIGGVVVMVIWAFAWGWLSCYLGSRDIKSLDSLLAAHDAQQAEGKAE